MCPTNEDAQVFLFLLLITMVIEISYYYDKWKNQSSKLRKSLTKLRD